MRKARSSCPWCGKKEGTRHKSDCLLIVTGQEVEVSKIKKTKAPKIRVASTIQKTERFSVELTQQQVNEALIGYVRKHQTNRKMQTVIPSDAKVDVYVDKITEEQTGACIEWERITNK